MLRCTFVTSTYVKQNNLPQTNDRHIEQKFVLILFIKTYGIYVPAKKLKFIIINEPFYKTNQHNSIQTFWFNVKPTDINFLQSNLHF